MLSVLEQDLTLAQFVEMEQLMDLKVVMMLIEIILMDATAIVKLSLIHFV